MTRLEATAASVSAPNRLVSETGLIAAYLIVDGKPAAGAGSTSLSISGGSLNVLYEVTGSDAGEGEGTRPTCNCHCMGRDR
jgi:hypothetical protein